MSTISESIQSERIAPFRFEDLAGKPEPYHWGPVYDIKRKRGQSVSEAIREKQISELRSAANGKWHVNLPADLKYQFSAAKHTARMKAAFTAAANADKRNWADGKPRPAAFGKTETIVEAYKQAMLDKAARLAISKACKPHYLLRAGEWKLAA